MIERPGNGSYGSDMTMANLTFVSCWALLASTTLVGCSTKSSGPGASTDAQTSATNVASTNMATSTQSHDFTEHVECTRE